ncbi:hydrogenase maturation protease [Methylacidiphilum kamchatkense]|uniref:Hydrogenase maturation protease n=1 Tax=Methylacidiphilum kamchatkense Kam1 TaxID=1202785 RepID=A0A516TLE7_9BACT|nr:hydrogenase maturation protease [Methylacidiphilum kamchatkense]QDQ42067.1 hydrogenase maturation protease [Methylacidiphilum kamchatkense Kam1]
MKGLIGGVGNIFFGDDGFGVEVIRSLKKIYYHPSESLSIIDFGIRTVDLAFELTNGYDWSVIIDAVYLGNLPGQIYLLHPEDCSSNSSFHPHQMDIPSVLRFAGQFGSIPQQTYLIGCEPETIEEKIGLSACVQQAVSQTANVLSKAIESLLVDQSCIPTKDFWAKFFSQEDNFYIEKNSSFT